MTSKELREKRAAIAAEIHKLADIPSDDKEKWTAEIEEKWGKTNAAYDSLTKEIEKVERDEKLQAEQKAATEKGDAEKRAGREDYSGKRADVSTIITPEDQALVIQGWCRKQCGMDVTDKHREAAQKLGVKLSARTLKIGLPKDYPSVIKEFRTTYYVSTTATYGGETIPAGFVPSFETALLKFGGVRQVASVLRTDSGNSLTWPTVNDTSNIGALLAEVSDDSGSAATEQGITTSSITLNAYKYTSKIVRVTVELLEDSAFNMASWLGAALGERLGRITNAHFTTGTGTGQPNGVVTASTAGVTAASATAIVADEIIDLIHSVDPAYREGGTFMMHDTVLKALRKLKDGDGAYIWQPGMAAGVPSTLFGYPVVNNQQMAGTIQASAKVILFGGLYKYIVRDVTNLRLRRLVERYAEYDQEGFVAFSRHDGELLDAGTHPVKHLIMHA